jgi:N-acetylglucosaminyl-diphospho-decaprenol L-rhamnosyltransferase
LGLTNDDPSKLPFSVVTVTHNSGPDTLKMVASLPAGVELVLIDNSSYDGVPERVRALRPDAVICKLDTNNGFGFGCNVGARRAGREVVVFLNPDCRPQPGALETIAEMAGREVGSIFGPALLNDDGLPLHNLRRRSVPGHEVMELLPSAKRWTPQRLRRDLPADDPRYLVGGAVDYLQGACLAVDRETFLKVGGFDADFFLYSEEETLCEAIVTAGGRCVYVPQAVVKHIGGRSTEQVSSFAFRHLYRSRAIFYRKRYGRMLATAAIASIGMAAVLQLLLHPLKIVRRTGNWRTLPAKDALLGLAAGIAVPISRR